MTPTHKVQGHCPMGCGETLFLGNGGHVTCSLIGCADPTAADRLLWNSHLPVDVRLNTYTADRPIGLHVDALRAG